MADLFSEKPFSSPESRQDAPGLPRKHLFVVGSPRSGTTWLQLLLAQHEAIATGKETQLFTQYINRLHERWEEELQEAEVATTNGLTRVLSEAEFADAARAFCDHVFDILCRDNPGAEYVLEKSPEHGLHARTILRLYPDARFLHILRDPRSVSNSFRHAAGRWWPWAPSGPISTARRWRSNVESARRIPELTQLYLEVRYEDLVDDGEATLESIFDWLSLDADRALCRAALDACAIEKLRKGEPQPGQPWNVEEEPRGFFRSGRKESWREELPQRDIRLIEEEAGELMVELGYTPETNLSRHRSRSPRRFLYWSIDRLRHVGEDLGHRVDWRLARLLSRL